MSDTNNNWKEREIGALWLKKTPNGVPFMSGTINGQRISIWKNKFYQEGAEPEQPIYRIYKDEAPAKTQSSTSQKSAESDTSDIPF